jgi:hypothetical protein
LLSLARRTNCVSFLACFGGALPPPPFGWARFFFSRPCRCSGELGCDLCDRGRAIHGGFAIALLVVCKESTCEISP